MKNDVVLKTHELKKIFGTVRAVDGVSLRVMRGQIYGFLGPNGSGKTTTIGMILGLLHPTSGTVRLFGDLITPYNTRPLRRVGAIIGAPTLMPYLSARQNLELLTRLSPGTDSARIDEVLDIVGIAKDAGRRVSKFSTGMKQRLGIALSLVHKPDLLILDEPTNGMDPAGMYEIRVLLSRLANQGATVFISSHLLHEVEQICDRVTVLKEGRVIAEGEVADLLGESRTVKLRVVPPNKAAQLLQQIPVCGEVRTNGAYITVTGLPSELIVSHLVSNGFIPTEVKTGQLDLEQIYLRLTNGESMEVTNVLDHV